MRRFALAALLAALAPAGLAAQGLGVGAKIGTTGYGVDVGLGLNNTLVLRGGIAVSPEELFITDLIPSDIDGIDYTLEPPTVTFTAGVDLHVLGPLRLMGGLMYRTEDLVARGDVSGSYEIGDETYTEDGTIWATLDQNEILPYAGIGLGKLSAGGFGIYLDLAVAYSGEADVTMTASENLSSLPGFTAELQKEADRFEEDAGIIKNLYPLLQVGVKLGLGR